MIVSRGPSSKHGAPQRQESTVELHPHVSFESAVVGIPTPAGKRFAKLFEHGSLEVELYAPRGRDEQSPHDRDEAYVVVHGEGWYLCDGKRHRFGPGDFLFAPAGIVHRFEEFSDDLVVWVLFYGPVGGESPRSSRA